jgi:hypothetical protein
MVSVQAAFTSHGEGMSSHLFAPGRGRGRMRGGKRRGYKYEQKLFYIGDWGLFYYVQSWK